MKNTELRLSEQTLESWALSRQSRCTVATLTSVDECVDLIGWARNEGLTIGPRGNGCSFADANQNTGQIVADMKGMNQIYDWDTQTGIIGHFCNFKYITFFTYPENYNKSAEILRKNEIVIK